MKDLRAAAAAWFLESYRQGGGGLVRTPVRPLPFRIGRQSGLGLVLPLASVSHRHAEIFERDGGLWLRDLGSTNGTFLNRERIEAPSRLGDGDILHFAEQEFRLVAESSQILFAPETTRLDEIELPRQLPGNLKELRRLLAERAVRPVFQPIVELAGGELHGYETLCRGAMPGLPESPVELLATAAAVGLEVEVSQAFRAAAVAAARAMGSDLPLFVNTHPREVGDQGLLLESLAAIRATAGELRLILEIHEAAVTDLGAMRSLAGSLADLGFGLAYDDFGAGQARLLELVEVPPHYLKFDMALIRDLDRSGENRRKLLATLVGMARELGIPTVAEGVETAAVAAACREAGFDLAQGYYFGPPAPTLSGGRRG